MPATSVYVETSIPSFYLDERRDQKIELWREYTRQWWDRQRRAFRLVTSDVVLNELRDGPKRRSQPALALMAGIRILDEPPRLAEVMAAYLEHKLLPHAALADAAHLAYASLHSIDVLLTWNCKHLANANKFQQIRVINTRLRISVPIVTTPITLGVETP